VSQRFHGNFRERAREFETCSTGSDDNERKPGARFFRSSSTFGAFERVENFVADGRRFLDGF
jgi:hypothetical protein